MKTQAQTSQIENAALQIGSHTDALSFPDMLALFFDLIENHPHFDDKQIEDFSNRLGRIPQIRIRNFDLAQIRRLGL